MRKVGCVCEQVGVMGRDRDGWGWGGGGGGGVVKRVGLPHLGEESKDAWR